MSKTASRVFITGMLFSIVACSVLLLKALEPGMDDLRNAAQPDLGFYTVLDVLSGDRLLVQAISGSKVSDSVLRQGRKKLFSKITGKPANIFIASNETFEVEVMGIKAPPLNDEAGLAEYAKTIGRDLEHLTKPRSFTSKKSLAENARGALLVFIYRQRVKINFPDPNNPTRGYVINNGDDIGKLQLLYGQAYATDEEHEFAEQYKGFEKEAKELKKGIWISE